MVSCSGMTLVQHNARARSGFPFARHAGTRVPIGPAVARKPGGHTPLSQRDGTATKFRRSGLMSQRDKPPATPATRRDHGHRGGERPVERGTAGQRIRTARDSLPGQRDGLPPGSLGGAKLGPQSDENRDPPANAPTLPP